MQKHKYITLVVGAAIALSPLAVLKAASLIGLSYGPIETELQTNTNINADLDAGASADNQDGGINAGAGASANSSISGDVMTIKREDVRDNPDEDRSENEVNDDSPLSTSGSISAQAGVNAGIATSNVATESDLRAFAENAIKSDENINFISFGNDNISVSYKDRGRFIGVIPVIMDVEVGVDQGGNVRFDYPWFGFLVIKDRADLEARVRAAVESSSSIGANGWTNYDRAELASRIAAALRAHYEAGDSATSTSEANR
ncbi:hypothetical protein KW796_01360 [Candidatus Parcubacteria bacterium]|nr:hypothetical protein [Candidatus Parcubacteria bacterium]